MAASTPSTSSRFSSACFPKRWRTEGSVFRAQHLPPANCGTVKVRLPPDRAQKAAKPVCDPFRPVFDGRWPARASLPLGPAGLPPPPAPSARSSPWSSQRLSWPRRALCGPNPAFQPIRAVSACPGTTPGCPETAPGCPGIIHGCPGIIHGCPETVLGCPGRFAGAPGTILGYPGRSPGCPGKFSGCPGRFPGCAGTGPRSPPSIPRSLDPLIRQSLTPGMSPAVVDRSTYSGHTYARAGTNGLTRKGG